MSSYLVTGGAGFIGSNLARRLLREGHKVLVIDDLSTGSLDNIPKGASFIRGAKIKNIYNYKMFDGIFHLGAPSSTPMYREDRSLVGKAISDFVLILEYAKRNNIKLVYASSSSVYNNCLIPYKEEMNLFPTDFYTEVRICWERLARVFYEQYNVKSIGLRLFAVYGPHEEAKKTYANLISQMLWAKLKDETFEIYGKGEQRRDETFVSDVVEAFVKAMNSDIDCDVFNIGTGINYSINDIANRIGVEIKYVPVPFNNYVEITLADTLKAEKVLGFKSKVALEEGLKRLKDWTIKGIDE